MSYRFQYTCSAKDGNSEFSLPSMVPYINLSKIGSYCFWVQDNSELGIVTSKQFHVSKIPTDDFWPVHKNNNSDFT